MSKTTRRIWNNHTNTTEHVKAFFKMNEAGAENVAFWAVIKNLPDVHDADGCAFIRTWHLHDSPKMHAVKRRKEFVWAGTNPRRVPSPNCGSHGCRPKKLAKDAFVVTVPKALV